MFDNIGGKIKVLAKAICWIGIIGSVIAGIVYWVGATRLQAGFVGFLAGLGIIAGGSLGSWIGCFTLYALGELVENSSKLVVQHYETNRKLGFLLGKPGFTNNQINSNLKESPIEKATIFSQSPQESPQSEEDKRMQKSSAALFETLNIPEIEDVQISGILDAGSCQICGKRDTTVAVCKFTDDTIILCPDCLKKDPFHSFMPFEEPVTSIYGNKTREKNNADSIGRCEICGKDSVPVKKCEVIEYKNGNETRHHCFVCKDCRKQYKDDNTQT